jgi:hypothetical protein
VVVDRLLAEVSLFSSSHLPAGWIRFIYLYDSLNSKCSRRASPSAQVGFRHLFYIIFVNVLLAKANHIANPDTEGGEIVPIS